MGLFNKDKYNLYEELKNDALFSDDDDDILVVPKFRASSNDDAAKHKVVAPHAITADELLGNSDNNSAFVLTDSHDSGSVYRQMTERNAASTGFDDSYVPSWANFETKEKDNEPIPEEAIVSAEEKLRSMNITSPVYSTPTAAQELAKEEEKQAAEREQNDFLARCRRAVSEATAKEPGATVVPTEVAAEPSEADEFADSIKDGFESIKSGKNVLNIEDIEEEIPVQHTPAEIEDIIRRLKNSDNAKAEESEKEAEIQRLIDENEKFYNNLPVCEIEIVRINETTPENAAETHKKELAQEFNTISETEKAPEHNGVYFFVSDGDNWDSAMAHIYFIDDENGGVFRLTARFFGEASEGHGNRFRQMIDTFKVIH